MSTEERRQQFLESMAPFLGTQEESLRFAAKLAGCAFNLHVYLEAVSHPEFADDVLDRLLEVASVLTAIDTATRIQDVTLAATLDGVLTLDAEQQADLVGATVDMRSAEVVAKQVLDRLRPVLIRMGVFEDLT